MQNAQTCEATSTQYSAAGTCDVTSACGCLGKTPRLLLQSLRRRQPDGHHGAVLRPGLYPEGLCLVLGLPGHREPQQSPGAHDVSGSAHGPRTHAAPVYHQQDKAAGAAKRQGLPRQSAVPGQLGLHMRGLLRAHVAIVLLVLLCSGSETSLLNMSTNIPSSRAIAHAHILPAERGSTCNIVVRIPHRHDSTDHVR